MSGNGLPLHSQDLHVMLRWTLTAPGPARTVTPDLRPVTSQHRQGLGVHLMLICQRCTPVGSGHCSFIHTKPAGTGRPGDSQTCEEHCV
ncbi:hypothetical protein ACOMHN_022870 [Nucella lapillus]